MRDCTVLLQPALARDLATSRDAQAKAVSYTALATTDYATQEEGGQCVALTGSSAVATKADSAVLVQAHIKLRWATIAAPISGWTGSPVGAGHRGRRSIETSSRVTTAAGAEPGSVETPAASSDSG